MILAQIGMGQHEIAFDEKRDLPMNKRQKLPYHTNGMRFTAYDADGAVIATRDYYSVGGGFVVGDWNGHGQIPGCSNDNCPATFTAGLDISMQSGFYRDHLPALVADRSIVSSSR